jgi:hypothetical protein
MVTRYQKGHVVQSVIFTILEESVPSMMAANDLDLRDALMKRMMVVIRQSSGLLISSLHTIWMMPKL